MSVVSFFKPVSLSKQCIMTLYNKYRLLKQYICIIYIYASMIFNAKYGIYVSYSIATFGFLGYILIYYAFIWYRIFNEYFYFRNYAIYCNVPNKHFFDITFTESDNFNHNLAHCLECHPIPLFTKELTLYQSIKQMSAIF